ncbi:hypothetical protein [Deinococcus peraridilitoris]|uniref:Uncharacterized protein n=1 Tax=Deinococcus peraridilitoris (strain DSM 19664 / LMG 22246 / CIP 109416 / KR-200) TaxID=937777 RepID=L0A175_DEIPD|nr:hypothetical protein [Deinococcus peraridilitoris]AFZ66765.1 hypothetical protein Deipe_1210 [Deinococcus peraridilitoris DSM 19664]
MLSQRGTSVNATEAQKWLESAQNALSSGHLTQKESVSPRFTALPRLIFVFLFALPEQATL